MTTASASVVRVERGREPVPPSLREKGSDHGHGFTTSTPISASACRTTQPFLPSSTSAAVLNDLLR
jgi:hypothetical protein